MGTTIGFLHTADVHRATFSSLVEQIVPDATSIHEVDESLLADARQRGGVDDELRARIVVRLRAAAAAADVVVCTCSTIGAAAEAARELIDVPLIRVDRPMAERAVALGSRLAVVAAVASTVAPTTALLRDAAARHGVELAITTVLCADAWHLFEAGDTSGYLQAVAAAVDGIAGPVDAVVLAQASMAGAAARCRTGVPVLSSPRLAVEAAALAASTRGAASALGPAHDAQDPKGGSALR